MQESRRIGARAMTPSPGLVTKLRGVERALVETLRTFVASPWIVAVVGSMGVVWWRLVPSRERLKFGA